MMAPRLIRECAGRAGCSGSTRRGYVLLETVIATGMLILGLAIIGGQIQDAQSSVRKMERRIRAIALAETQLGYLDLGLIEFESLNEIEEDDFGPRYPDWGWRLITEETGIEGMYALQLEILYLPREEEYAPDSYDHDNAEMIYTVRAMRPTVRPLNVALDFGLNEEETEEFEKKLADSGLPFSIDNFPPNLFGQLSPEQLPIAAAFLLELMGDDVGAFLSQLPPDIRALIEQLDIEGLLDEANQNDNGGENP